MWADHHVLVVRKALMGVAGLETIDASARDRSLRVRFDPQVISSDQLVGALAAAGYPPGDLVPAGGSDRNKPAWSRAPRVTATNATDLAMSGDYRQY
jgi:copper chaperone CopZ